MDDMIFPGKIGRPFYMEWKQGDIPGFRWLRQVSMWIAGITSPDGTIDVIYNNEGIALSINRLAVQSISGSGGSGGSVTPHPWQISTRVDSGNQQYSIAAGAVYNWAGTLVTVASVTWTTITATTSLYLNLSYSSGTLTITVSSTAATEDPYGSTGTWSVKIGEVTVAGGVITGTLQTLHDYYDIRGRMIPSAITGFTYANQQALTHASSGSLAWVNVATCATT
jgi:hypothetical protein